MIMRRSGSPKKLKSRIIRQVEVKSKGDGMVGAVLMSSSFVCVFCVVFFLFLSRSSKEKMRM